MSVLAPWTGGRLGIVMMSAIGDAVHVLPLVTALKRHPPRTHLTWILQPGPASLVRGHQGVDEIVLFDKASGWRAYGGVRRALPEPFDLVLALQVYFRAGLVTSLVPAGVKLGFDRARARDLNWLFTTHQIPPHAPQHVQDQYGEFLTAIGIAMEPVAWDLGPWPHERAAQAAFVARIGRPGAALAIASTDPEREWPAARWAELAGVLWNDYGLAPVLVGGRSPHEQQLEAAIRATAPCPITSTLGASLRELVGILDASALVVAINSAPLHMAVALNRPVISLLGHWNPKRTGPFRRFHDLRCDGYGEPGEDYPISMVRRKGTMARITMAMVREKLEMWRTRYGPEWRRPADAW